MSLHIAVKELKKRVILTLSILVLYRLGTFIPIPGIRTEVIEGFFSSDKAEVLSMVNLFSGGALERMSIFALNIMPYITSSIIMQLLSSINKSIEEIKKDGEKGRSKINQYTRYLTILLATLQSLGVFFAFTESSENIFNSESFLIMLTTCFSLVGGTVILMWLGEKITASGIGNGISLIIFVGISSSLPSTLSEILNLLKIGSITVPFAFLSFLSIFAIFTFVCFVEKIYRKIKIQYSNSSLSRYQSGIDSTFLPIKLNISGVIPPIFASSLLMFPLAIIQFTGNSEETINQIFQRGGFVHLLLFSFFILFFSYFYSSIVFNTKEVAENLKKSNCYVVGIRPGILTSNYLDNIIAKITLIGGIYLVIICILPEILITKTLFPIHIGGTGILIMVSVVMDLINQLQSHLINNKYSSGSIKKRKIRIRR